MLAPAATGFGAASFDRVRTGAEVTVVVAFGPEAGSASLQATVQPELVITVPLASGEFTFTTRVTEPATPALTLPMFQVTTPAAQAPPPVALTKLVLAGSGSAITPAVALFVPMF